jgi:hypothetical protein
MTEEPTRHRVLLKELEARIVAAQEVLDRLSRTEPSASSRDDLIDEADRSLEAINEKVQEVNDEPMPYIPHELCDQMDDLRDELAAIRRNGPYPPLHRVDSCWY